MEINSTSGQNANFEDNQPDDEYDDDDGQQVANGSLSFDVVGESPEADLCQACGQDLHGQDVKYCPDCNYVVCGTCACHTIHGTCFCLHSNFGEAYCNLEPAAYHGARHGPLYIGPYKCEAQMDLEQMLDSGQQRIVWDVCRTALQQPCCSPSFHSCRTHKLILSMLRSHYIDLGIAFVDLVGLRILSFLIPCRADLLAKRRGIPLQPLRLKACSKCKSVVYCSRACQHLDRREHKEQCGPYVPISAMPYVCDHDLDRQRRFPHILR
jgi:hypothetical protein